MSRTPERSIWLRGTAQRAAAAYLTLADRVLPGRVTALYLVGSAALGAFRPGRSDVDLVVVLDDRVDARRLRALHLLSAAREIVSDARAGDDGPDPHRGRPLACPP